MRSRLSLSVVPLLVALGASWGAVASAATCGLPYLFGPAAYTSVGSNPTGALVADLDADGKLDLLVLSSYYYVYTPGAGRLTMLKGNGDGTFAPGVDYAVPGAPWRIARADLDGDGIPDLVITCYKTNTISVLKGLGSGGIPNGAFGPVHTFYAGPGPSELAVADFDHDGHLDVAVTDNGTTAVSLLHGYGDGTFGPPVSFGLNNQPTEMAAADLDGDGWMDLVACVNYSSAVAVLKGQPGGMFAPAAYFPAGIEPNGVAIRDWDGDGILDLMTGNGSSGGVQFLKGTGSGGVWGGSFQAPRQILPGNGDIVLPLDVNGDGKLDLVTALTNSFSATPVEVALGDGAGNFAAPTNYPVGVVPTVAVTGDFDGDGRPDLAVTDFLGSEFAVLLGTCSASPNAPAITAVRDVPNDQGGKVFVTWTRSALDVSGGAVTGYRVWREIPPAMAQARLRAEPSAMSVIRVTPGRAALQTIYWEALATLPAQRLAGYGYTASTPQDSLAGSNPFSVFFITAITASPDVFYDSAPDSGYSVDNLAPFAPQGLSATLTGSGAQLHWHANGEADLAGYRLYRGPNASFVPSAATLVAALSDTQTVDAHGGPGDVYKLVAVDVHGNTSAAATAGIDLPTAVTATAMPPVVASDAVTLTWQVDSSAPIGIERSGDGVSWAAMATVVRDGDALLRWTDRTVSAATTYQYRLVVPDGGGRVYAGEIEVRVPGYELALVGVRPNPLVQGPFEVRFTLASGASARLDVLDIGGRRVSSLDVGGYGAGPHVVDLDRGARMPAGLYVIRLTSAGRVLSTKAVVMR